MTPQSEHPSMAYVAVLSTDDFLDGVLVLKESLRLCRAQYPLHVAVGSKVSESVRRTLASAKLPQIALCSLDIPDYVLSANEQSDFHRHWVNVFDKLHVFSLCQFNKIVFIDCDVLVIRNIDDLFSKPHMSATVAGAIPGHKPSRAFSAGLMVIEPEPGLTDRLVGVIPAVFEQEKGWRAAAGRPVSIGAQSVINELWPEWFTQADLHLRPTYNLMATHLDYYMRELDFSFRGVDPIRVLHFDGEAKPWMMKGSRFWRRTSRLLARRRFWELAALWAYKVVLRRARLRLIFSNLI